MNNRSCTCGCSDSREAQFRELKPVLDQYAEVPGSLITLLQKTQEFTGIFQVMPSTTYPKPQVSNPPKFMAWQRSMRSSD